MIKMPIMWFDNEHNSPGSLSAKLATDAVASNSN